MRLVLSIIIVLAISGNVQSQKYTGVYKKIRKPTIEISNPKDVVDLEFISSKSQPSLAKKEYKSITDLGELAQYKLISSYSKSDTTSKSLKGSVFEPYSGSKKKSSKIVDEDRLLIYRKLTFFIDDNWVRSELSNRILSLRITVRLDSNNVKFEKFNGFQTKYEYYEFGSLEGTKTRNFSLGAEVAANNSSSSATFDDAGNQTSGNSSSFGPKLTGSFGGSRSLKENINPKRRAIVQTGLLSDNQLLIYLEGLPTKNLNGPIDVDVAFSIGDQDKQEIFDYVNFSISENKPVLTPKFLIKPDTSLLTDVTADIFLEWSYRRVYKKGGTSFEGDDKIEIYNSSSSEYLSNQVLIPKKDMGLNIYYLEYSGNPIFVKSSGGRTQNANFLTREEAVLLRNYMIDKKTTKINGYEIVDTNSNSIPVSSLMSISIIPDGI